EPPETSTSTSTGTASIPSRVEERTRAYMPGAGAKGMPPPRPRRRAAGWPDFRPAGRLPGRSRRPPGHPGHGAGLCASLPGVRSLVAATAILTVALAPGCRDESPSPSPAPESADPERAPAAPATAPAPAPADPSETAAIPALRPRPGDPDLGG